MKRRKFINRSASLASGLMFATGMSKVQSVDKKEKLNITEEKKIVGIEVFAPSVIRLGEEFQIGIKIKCEPFFTNAAVRWEREEGAIDGPFNKSARGTTFMDNVLPEWSGTIKLSGSEGFHGLNSYSFLENFDL